MSAGNRAYRQSIRYSHRQVIEIAAVRKGDRRQALVNSSLKRITRKGYIADGDVFSSNSLEDEKGLDAWLLKWDGKKIEFQIKGCDRGVKEHLKKHPNIPVVLIHGWELGEEIDCLLIDQFHLKYLPRVFTKGVNGISQRQLAARIPTAQPNKVFSVGSNGFHGSNNGSCEKHAQNVPCY